MSQLARLVPALAALVAAAATAPPALATPPPAGNVIQLGDGSILPVYAVAGSATVSAVGFSVAGGVLRAYDQSGSLLWSQATSGRGPFGGFDFDADGWPDTFVVLSSDTGRLCGTQHITTTSLQFFSGRTGAAYTPTAPLEDLCWSFPPTPPYVTHQWSEDTVHWGAGIDDLGMSPYYATTSWYFGFNGTQFTTDGALYYPSTSSYDTTYTADRPNAHGTGTSYEQYSHVANGLLMNVGGSDRFVFWTTARVAQYAVGPLGSGQLLYDYPYLTGGRTDILGRNYGLVAVDPGAPSTLFLIAGTPNESLFLDMKSGTMSADPWGGIERHVTFYDAATNGVQDRYYSYAHDNDDGNKYEGRVSFPANPFVVRAGASRIAYNVYQGGHWYLHVSMPGSTTDRYALPDAFLWDIADVDGDGVDDWIISPTRYATDPNVPGYYFSKWVTYLEHWDESTQTLTAFKTYDDAIPNLDRTFVRPTATSSTGFLNPAEILIQNGQRYLVMLNSSKQVVLAP